MAKGLHDLLSRQHKYGSQNGIVRPNVRASDKSPSEELEELRIGVRSILTSLGNKCRVSELENEYRNWFGKKLPFRELGSPNSIALLKRIPEACEISDETCYDPLVSVKNADKSAHISSLIQKSKTKPKPVSKQSVPQKDIFVPFTVQDEIRRLLYKRRSIRKTDFIKLLEDSFDLNFMNLEVSIEMLVRSLPHILINDGAFVKSAYKIEKDEIEIPQELKIKDQWIIPSYRLGHYESIISQNLCALLTSKKQMYVFDVPRFYLQKFGKDLKWYQYGFEDLWRFLQLLPGQFSLFKSDSGYIVAASVVPGTVDLREFHEQDLCGDEVYEEVLEKIRNLVLHVNVGLNSKHLITAYETLYFEKLVIRTNFDQFVSELDNKYIFKAKEIGTSCILFPCNMYDLWKLQEEKKKVKHLPHPNSVLKPGDSLKHLDFAEVINANNQQFFAGYVSFVESPNHFYIRVAGMGQNHKLELEDEFDCMMEAMTECYSLCSDEYDIPLSDLKVKMVCAACVKGKWQRVVVLDVLDRMRVLVKSVDHGTYHKVMNTDLKYLPKRFSVLPMLAHRATLFNIGPSGREWSLEAVLEFRNLTVGDDSIPKPLSVLVIHRSEEGVLQVLLADESESLENVTHIGDELVDLGYGSFRFDEAFGAMYC